MCAGVQELGHTSVHAPLRPSGGGGYGLFNFLLKFGAAPTLGCYWYRITQFCDIGVWGNGEQSVCVAVCVVCVWEVSTAELLSGTINPSLTLRLVDPLHDTQSC